MINFIYALLLAVPMSLSALTMNNGRPVGKILISNVEELKTLILTKGDYQVYRHEYVPHYRVADFHLYIKGNTLILYNQHDADTKEYIVTQQSKKKEHNNYYAVRLQQALSQFIAKE